MDLCTLPFRINVTKLRRLLNKTKTLRFDSVLRPCKKKCKHLTTAYYSKKENNDQINFPIINFINKKNKTEKNNSIGIPVFAISCSTRIAS
tara:strand:- start:1679 stop:1951 length:273 start_codon:yes stop_codon:yes gene_type:complete